MRNASHDNYYLRVARRATGRLLHMREIPRRRRRRQPTQIGFECNKLRPMPGRLNVPLERAPIVYARWANMTLSLCSRTARSASELSTQLNPHQSATIYIYIERESAHDAHAHNLEFSINARRYSKCRRSDYMHTHRTAQRSNAVDAIDDDATQSRQAISHPK